MVCTREALRNIVDLYHIEQKAGKILIIRGMWAGSVLEV